MSEFFADVLKLFLHTCKWCISAPVSH